MASEIGLIVVSLWVPLLLLAPPVHATLWQLPISLLKRLGQSDQAALHVKKVY